jgi:hypothetical protein
MRQDLEREQDLRRGRKTAQPRKIKDRRGGRVRSREEALDGVVEPVGRPRSASIELGSESGKGGKDLLAFHAHPVQRALGNEDAATAEHGRRLGDGDRAEAEDVAEEPEAVEEASRLDRPSRASQPVDSGQMLGVVGAASG